MNKGLKKAAAFCLSAGLALTSVTGCSKKEEKFDTAATALTVNGTELSVGVLNFMAHYYQANLESLYMSIGATDPYDQDLFGSGMTLGEQTKSQVVSEMTNALLAEQHMEDYGVTVSDEEKAQISAAASQFMADNDTAVLEQLHAEQTDIERFLELSLIQNKVEKEMAADVDTEVSDDEAAQRRVQYVLFAPITAEEEETELETETELTEDGAAESELPETEAAEVPESESIAAVAEVPESESEAAAEEDAETESETAALDEKDAEKTKAAKETETVTEETPVETEAVETEAAETEQTEAETEDPETVAARERAYVKAAEMIERVKAGEDFEAVAEELGKNVSDTTFGADYSITALVEATDGLADGTLVEEPVLSANGSYYVVRLVSQLDREATDEKKVEIVDQRKSDRINEMYTEWTNEAEVSSDEEVLAKIVFNYHLEQPAAEEEVESELQSEEQTE